MNSKAKRLDLMRAREEIKENLNQRYPLGFKVDNTILTAFEGLDVGLRVGSFDTVGEIVGELEGDPVGLSEGE